MSRVERVDMLLRQIEHETKVAFDEHSELLSQNARLKAENVKLWERIKLLEAELEGMHLIREQDRAENDELRDLCADLYAEMLTYSNAPTYNASVWSAKLRELGIEVGE